MIADLQNALGKRRLDILEEFCRLLSFDLTQVDRQNIFAFREKHCQVGLINKL